MMRAPRRRLGWWFAYALIWMGLFGALFLFSRSLRALDDAERKARHDAALEENLRLSLWRLDSSISPILAQKSLQPVSDDPPAEASAEALLSDSQRSITQIPIARAFRWNPSEAHGADDPQNLALQVAALQRKQKEYQRFRTLSETESLPVFNGDPNASALASQVPPGFSSQQNRTRAANEFQQRAQNIERGNQLILQNSGVASPVMGYRPLTALWQGDELLLVRGIAAQNNALEGWVIQWDEMNLAMKSVVQDLLPEASFVPIRDVANESSPDMLISIPVRLVSGNVVGDAVEDLEPQGRWSVPFILALLWSTFGATAIATGAAIGGILRLSERREAFVAAVTHELRTPLTTLRLYTEMLNSDMIRDEATKRSYLTTLENEVARIGHLVENVFAFARLERGRRSLHQESLELQTVLERSAPRFQEIAARAGMTFSMEPSEAMNVRVAADGFMVEQILSNVIDNACKYAREAEDPTIRLHVEASDTRVRIVVEDRGPGFRPHPSGWTPFFKSVEQAADTAPGIGLGLALCQRLAKQMGGRFLIESAQPQGAKVVLELPRAP